jgi:flagellar protein FlgJ
MTSPLSTSLPPLAAAPAAPVAPAQANTYTDLNALASLKNAPASGATIKAVSEQVEALFLQMMLKSMRDAGEAAGEPESNETGMYQDMFDKQVALTLSKRQDLGIARLFERQLGGQTPGGKASGGNPPGGEAPGLKSPSDVPAGAASPSQLKQLPAGALPDARGRAAAPPPTGANFSEQAAGFVQQVLPTIRQAAAALGVNPLGLLAQAALETGWGRRTPRTADGTSSLNLFGVKAGSDWSGARAVADTVEINAGVAQQTRTAFRAYGSIEESVGDFARLLSSSPRYREAAAAGGSAEAYVQRIAKAGYATDPEYANKLNDVLNSGTLRAALGARLAKL